MKAIILAAGINSRLKDYINIPKCLLPLGDKTILENQVSSLIKAGFKQEDILVVVGHKHEMIEKVHNNTLFNPKFAEFNNGYSVYLALQYILHECDLPKSEKIFILDGDLVYDNNLILKISSSDNENILVNKPIDYSLELKDEISVLDSNGKIVELQIPSQKDPLAPEYSQKPLYSYAGIMKISKNVATQLHEKLKTSHQGWYTLSLPEIVLNNDIYSFEITEDLKYCFDVDTKEDLDKLSNIN
ncbi:MAG: NTP transferase domain-containing protein [Nanoarchaeota archaeon]